MTLVSLPNDVKRNWNYSRRSRNRSWGLNGRKKKKVRRKVENGEKKSLVTMFYWTSSKRSRPFWLVIGAIKLLCFSARERAPDLGVISCVLIYTQSIRSSAVWLFREALYTRCDYLTGKYAGPFAGIITVAHLTLLLWCSYQTRDRPFPFSKSIFFRRHSPAKKTATRQLREHECV